jgi:hypothetical protein
MSTLWTISGINKGHAFGGFLKSSKIVTRKSKKMPGSTRIRRYVWVPTGERAPSPVPTLKGWIQDARVDHIIIAHSQGTNITMYLLKRGYQK